MSNAILIHGKPDRDEYYDQAEPAPSNHHWFPWLQKQLTIRGIDTQTPEMLDAWKPYYPVWQQAFERYDITPETLLVGHSCGGGFLVRWLSEHPDRHVGKVVLVAPSLGKDWTVGQEFFDFKLDPNVAARTKELVIFESDNDGDGLKAAHQVFRTNLKGAHFRDFHNYGHFCLEDMGHVEFPELLQALVGDLPAIRA